MEVAAEENEGCCDAHNSTGSYYCPCHWQCPKFTAPHSINPGIRPFQTKVPYAILSFYNKTPGIFSTDENQTTMKLLYVNVPVNSWNKKQRDCM
jgi:hypothetical protein